MTPPDPARLHTWDGGTLPDWLSLDDHHYDGDELVVRTPDGDTRPQPGWLLVKWTDGAVTVCSPTVAARVYGPNGLASRLQRAEAATDSEVRRQLADAVAALGRSETDLAQARRTIRSLSTVNRSTVTDLTRRTETAEAVRDDLARRLGESRSGEAILGQRVLGWVALAESHQHWGQRRWNAWKSAHRRAREWRARAEQAEAAVARVSAECDRIDTAVRANPTNPDFDGAYLAALGHIRTALAEPKESTP